MVTEWCPPLPSPSVLLQVRGIKDALGEQQQQQRQAAARLDALAAELARLAKSAAAAVDVRALWDAIEDVRGSLKVGWRGL